MWIGIVTLLPELFGGLTESGVVARGVRDGVLSLSFANPRDFTEDRHRTVDDKPFGGGAGMVLKPEPLAKALASLRRSAPPDTPVVLMSPRGQPFKQANAASLASLPGLILVAGRYEGIDQRFIDAHVDHELSIGDYVLSGGELPAMVVVDAVARLLPGVLGNESSADDESFSDGLLEYPQYTRSSGSDDDVPAVLRSGDHGKISSWRLAQSLRHTYHTRPEMLARRGLSSTEAALLREAIQSLREGEGDSGGSEPSDNDPA